MPTIDSLITESNIQVIRPVAEQVTRSLLRYLGIYQVFEKDGIYLGDENMKAIKFESDEHTPKVRPNRCDVAIEPNFDPTTVEWDMFTFAHVISSNTNNRDLFGEFPLFADKKANIYMHEVRVPCSVGLEFNIQVRSAELAEMIHGAIFNKFMTEGIVSNYNDIAFNYPVPDMILLTLFKLFKMRDFGEDEVTLEEYMKYGSNNAFDVLVNRDDLQDDDRQLVISRTSNGVIGKLVYDGVNPEPIMNGKIVERYAINFKYVFQFSRPNILRMSFPIMVDNVTVPSFLISKSGEMHEDYVDSQHPEVAINQLFEASGITSLMNSKYTTIRYPDYDEWVLPYRNYEDLRRRYMPIFIGLLSVDIDPQDASKSITMDLNEIYPMLNDEMSAALDAALTENPGSIMNGRNGIFNITLFSGEHVVSLDRVILDENKVLTVTENLDSSKLYRLTINIVKDLGQVDRELIYYMLDNPEFFDAILSANIGYLESTGYIEIIKTENPAETDIVQRPNYSQNTLRGYKNGFGQTIRLGHFVVVARRQ